MQETLSNLKLSTIDQIVVWYGMLPAATKTVISCVVGAVLAYIAFKIVIKIVKTVVHATVAAVGAFLAGTVPGNLIMAQAFTHVQEQFGPALNQLINR